jgi:UDP-2,3-diacylglucosamine pyrophosphatase LpxH
MIVVISDLHMEEEASDAIPASGTRPALIFRRNQEAKGYRSFIAEIAERAEKRRVREFRLVIAGDLFDFNRTVLWFKDELRPYISLNKVSAPLEQKVLRILNAIAAEPQIREALDILRMLARGEYVDRTGKKRDFPASRVNIDYLAGNHDRLCNLSPMVRKRIRELLGMKGDDPFAHLLLFSNPSALIRHGHEYDRNNFALDPEKMKTIPLELPDDGYAESNFGDFVTIDIATRLPWLLRREYGDSSIRDNEVLSSLYLRLLKFDDVRPQSALFDYLLDDSHGHYSAEEAWECLMPIIDKVVEEIHDHPFFRFWLKQRAKPWAGAELEATRGLMKLGGWKNRVARETARKIAHFMMGGDMAHPQFFAQREELLVKQKVRLVLAGHTHMPQVCLVGSDANSDRFYVNTGTWRDRILTTPDDRTFGRINALTYVELLSSSERTTKNGEASDSFAYWNGVTRDWPENSDESRRPKLGLGRHVSRLARKLIRMGKR